MPALSAAELAALLTAGCSSCGKTELRARALATGTMLLADGEPSTSMTWIYEKDQLFERIYRLECLDCGAASHERDDCPLCKADGGLARALSGRHGVAPPAACPHCDHPELKITVEARMHVIYVLGHIGRRVLDAEPHEPAFHVTQAQCPSCQQTVASVSQRCAACGRSSLLRKRT